MSNDELDNISSIIDQIKLCLPNIEESVTSMKSEIPPHLSYRLFNIQSSLTDIDEQVKYKSILSKPKNDVSSDQQDEKKANAISVSDGYSIQIEKHKRYLTKHLNNAIQRHLSELDDKMKKIESDYIPYLTSTPDAKTTSDNSFTDLESAVTKSFSDFNCKYQDLYSKITNVQVNKKFIYEKGANHLSKSISTQIKQQQNDIKILQTKIDETQKLIDNYNNDKTIKAEEPIQNPPELPDIRRINQEQKSKINYLKSQWINIREAFKKQLVAVDSSFNALMKSSDKVKNAMANYEKKIDIIQSDMMKFDETFDSIQDKINDEINKIDRSTLKDNISRLKLTTTLTLENDKSQIDDLVNCVNDLYDRITESFLL